MAYNEESLLSRQLPNQERKEMHNVIHSVDVTELFLYTLYNFLVMYRRAQFFEVSYPLTLDAIKSRFAGINVKSREVLDKNRTGEKNYP